MAAVAPGVEHVGTLGRVADSQPMFQLAGNYEGRGKRPAPPAFRPG